MLASREEQGILDSAKAKGFSLDEVLELETEFWERIVSADERYKKLSGSEQLDFWENLSEKVEKFIAEEYRYKWNEYTLAVAKLKRAKTILLGILYVSIGSTGVGITIFIGCFICWLIKRKKMSKFVDIVCFCISPTVLATAFLVNVIYDDILLLVVSVCIFLLLLGIVRVYWKVGDLKNRT